MLERIDTNPDGLHQKYVLSHHDGSPVDPKGCYFVLRLDSNGADPEWVRYCRDGAYGFAVAAELAGGKYARVGAELKRVLCRIFAEQCCRAANFVAGHTSAVGRLDSSHAAECLRKAEEVGLTVPMIQALPSPTTMAELRLAIAERLAPEGLIETLIFDSPEGQQILADRFGVPLETVQARAEARMQAALDDAGLAARRTTEQVATPSPNPSPQGGGATTLPSPQGGGEQTGQVLTAKSQEPANAPGTEQGSLAAETASAPQGSA